MQKKFSKRGCFETAEAPFFVYRSIKVNGQQGSERGIKALISNRQKQILWLLQKSDGPLNAKAIGERLGISDRTVREEIRQIQQKSDELGVKLKVLRGKGYLLEKVDYRRLLQLEENGFFAEQEERVKYILKRLLLEKEYVRLEDLEADMYVSKSTLHTDLKKVRKILKKYDLTVANRPHYGTKVEGGEFRKRLCLADSIFGWQNKPGQQNTPFNQDLFQKVKQILIRAISKYRIRFSDIELQNLETHITLACKRIEDGFTIEPLPFHFKEPYTFERKVAKEITGEVEKISGIPFPPAEMDYILVHLLGTKLISKHIARQVSDEIDDIVNAILRKLKIQFHWDFSNDKEFRNGLTLHLQTSLNRMKYKMNIRNPLLNEMKTKFPIAFEGAVAAGECIEAVIHRKVNEDEISYLAIHIAIALERMRKKKRVLVVCETGVGSAKILSHQLENRFANEIEIVDTISYYHLSHYDLSRVDLIVSTIMIPDHLEVPVVVVSHFLEENDATRIQREIGRLKGNVQKYMEPSKMFIHQELDSKEKVIQFLCKKLAEQHAVPENYATLVLKRVAIASTAFGNLVAVPHPIEPVTHRTFWTICTLARPIQWDEDKKVQLVCLLNVGKEDGNLNAMYKYLTGVIQNKAAVQKIIKSNTVEELIQCMEAG